MSVAAVDDGLRRLAIAVLLRAVQDAQEAKRLPDWATPADRQEAIAFDRSPWFGHWCVAAGANPRVVSHHLRARLPVVDRDTVKLRATGRLCREGAAGRRVHAQRAAATRWAAA